MKKILFITTLFLTFVTTLSVSFAKDRAANTSTSSNAESKLATTADQPGLFRIDQSTNSKVCSSLGRIINADIKKYGKTRFEEHSEFIKWSDVAEGNIDRGNEHKYSESVEQADADINNDGLVDKVIRTKWSLRNVLQDALDIFPQNETKKIVIDELQRDDKEMMFASGKYSNEISFNSGNYWVNRRVAKYGDNNYDWAFDGVASLNLLRQNDVTYVVAQNYAAPSNVSAKIYVFQLNKDYQPIDVCMFVKICQCAGCKDTRGSDEESKTLPAKKWCSK